MCPPPYPAPEARSFAGATGRVENHAPCPAIAASLGWLPTVLLAVWFAGLATAPAETLLTESRTPFLHNIPLHDEADQVISLPPLLGEDGKFQEAKAAPYATAQTCGKCHDYSLISQGWHFNAASGNVKAGRPGEPWLLTDPATCTQIPLSYRGWPGTFNPAELGLSHYDFLTNFARHFPGGGVGEPAKIDASDPKLARQQITGTMQIDCLICHQASGRYDHEARFLALKNENFRWSPTIAAGLGSFASFRGAGSLADRWRPGKALPPLPAIKYDRARFDVDNNVVVQVTRRPAAGNCYYCHTSQSASGDAWHSDFDVHLRAGLLCTDCHRSGLDHTIVRGYEGEARDRTISDQMVEARVKRLQCDSEAPGNEEARKLARAQLESELGQLDTLTCRGCHASGNLGAPRPVHQGLPPVHFEKLTCTACHSGPWPGPQPEIVHTSLAHKLGLPAPARGKSAAPVIVQPVFLAGADGKIAPYKMVWPSYWARRKDGKLTVLLPGEMAKSGLLPQATEGERAAASPKPLTEAQIQKALESLPGDPAKGEAVFVAVGKLYRLDQGKLISEESAAAKPYSWALAHDVRPARQALGAKGCADCHDGESPLFFASVQAQGPVEPGKALTKAAWELRGSDKTWIQAFAFTFHFRPWLKFILFGAAFLLLAVLLYYALRGVGALTAADSKKKPEA